MALSLGLTHTMLGRETLPPPEPGPKLALQTQGLCIRHCIPKKAYAAPDVVLFYGPT